MKKRQLSTLLVATLLALSASACAAADLTEQETQGASPNAGADTGAQDTADEAGENATDVTNNSDDTETPAEAANPVSVTFQKTHDEFTADDGTVLLTNDTVFPVVAIEGAEDIAAKINADLEEYYADFTSEDDEVLEWARSDYEASQADEGGGWWNSGYTQNVDVNVTRMDDAVLSLELIAGAYTGGAHGNYGSLGRNYDTKTGELIRFEDLAKDISAFHATALDYMVNLAANPPYKEMLFEPSKTDLDSTLFQTGSWVFTGSGLSFFADPYALGPYASGEIYFRLPYEKAYDLGLKDAYRYTGNYMQERYYTSQYDENMELLIDGTPEYSFDLNGDGTEEGIAFYGITYDAASGSSKVALYIDGKDWGDVLEQQIDGSTGFYDTTYVLYDRDPSDDMTEIAVLFTEFYDDGSDAALTGRRPYTYLFRYTAEKELEFEERLDGFITNPVSP